MRNLTIEFRLSNEVANKVAVSLRNVARSGANEGLQFVVFRHFPRTWLRFELN